VFDSEAIQPARSSADIKQVFTTRCIKCPIEQNPERAGGENEIVQVKNIVLKPDHELSPQYEGNTAHDVQ
jgi:hypothetical protein